MIIQAPERTSPPLFGINIHFISAEPGLGAAPSGSAVCKQALHAAILAQVSPGYGV